EGQSLIVAGALLSISLNPAMFGALDRLGDWIGRRPRLLALLERPAGAIGELPAGIDTSGMRDHAIIVGHGRVGGAIGETLARYGVPYFTVEQDRELVESLRVRGVPAFFGDASRPGVLAQANVRQARLLVVTAPDPFKARAIITTARRVNPDIDTVVRTHSDDERDYLEALQVGMAVMGERELARTMASYALHSCGVADEAFPREATRSITT
ncbi:MAG: NAD-binding protein, partial [Gemmatimonadota bacterium]